jgi:hypothetical protein
VRFAGAKTLENGSYAIIAEILAETLQGAEIPKGATIPGMGERARIELGSLPLLQESLRKVRRLGLTQNGPISMFYEFRSKSAQSRGLEKNGRRERISGLGRRVPVQRFARGARDYWAFIALGGPAENVGRG